MRHADFVRGDFDTGFVEKILDPKPLEMKQ
jgi:hypothetical protein